MAPAKSRATRAATSTLQRLAAAHPDADCELEPREPFRLLIAVVLSAQTTDVAVNRLLPALFDAFPDAEALAKADVARVETLLQTIGMFRQKARNIVALSSKLVSDFHGEVPATLEELVSLPGVGRKTANVVLGVAFNIPAGVVVDTHVQRVSQRLGWTRESEPPAIEADLNKLFPPEEWIRVSHVLIFHGRRVCAARAPNCPACPVNDVCPSAFKAELVGRKPTRTRVSTGRKA